MVADGATGTAAWVMPLTSLRLHELGSRFWVERRSAGEVAIDRVPEVVRNTSSGSARGLMVTMVAVAAAGRRGNYYYFSRLYVVLVFVRLCVSTEL